MQNIQVGPLSDDEKLVGYKSNSVYYCVNCGKSALSDYERSNADLIGEFYMTDGGYLICENCGTRLEVDYILCDGCDLWPDCCECSNCPEDGCLTYVDTYVDNL